MTTGRFKLGRIIRTAPGLVNDGPAIESSPHQRDVPGLEGARERLPLPVSVSEPVKATAFGGIREDDTAELCRRLPREPPDRFRFQRGLEVLVPTLGLDNRVNSTCPSSLATTTTSSLRVEPAEDPSIHEGDTRMVSGVAYP